MSANPSAMRANPLERVADRVPSITARAVSVGAIVLGVGLALWYAYDQDTLFPGEHFPRTWTIVAFTAAVAVVSLVPGGYRWSGVVAAAGAGALIFGGANLAHRTTGVTVVVCGVVAAAAIAVWNHRRGEPLISTLVGLALAGVLTALMIGAIVQFVDE
jgi:hypothetical protein